MTLVGGSARFLVPFLFVASLGCRQVLGIHHRDVEDAGATTEAAAAQPTKGRCGAIVYASEPCAQCMDEGCCGVAQTCHDDSQCDAAAACFLACAAGDSDCRGRCQAFYGQPNQLHELTSCRARNCAVQCDEPCGDMNNGVSSCDSCIATSCCEAAEACASDSDCLRLQDCRSNCLSGATTCPDDCQTRYSGAGPRHAAWSQCTQTTCADFCRIGTAWSCLDQPKAWPLPPKPDAITFSLTIVDLLEEKPFHQVEVRACAKLDATCARPLDSKIADDTGTVTMRVPVGTVGFDGYLEISKGTLDGTGPPIYPSLWFPVPPYIAGGSKGTGQFVSTEEFVALEILTGVSDDPMRGAIALNARDCNFTPAGGVAFKADKADKATQSFYFVNGAPDTTAKATDAQAAIGGIVNLPAGLAVITGTLPDQGDKPIGNLTFIIRPGTLTAAFFMPPP
jgi:hypothetical protein